MDVSERLKTLPGMSKVALSQLWEELFNKPVPERIRKELMVRILAYRMQEQAFGGLNSKTRRRLDQIAGTLGKNQNAAIANMARCGDLWYNVFDGTSWLPNDLKITQGGHSKTSAGPAMAEYNGKLYLAYKGSGSDDLWYNVFDGTSWLPNDLKITQGGHSKTSRRPALAVYGMQLYLAYRSGGSDDIWYNVFAVNSWLAQDISVTHGGSVQTAEGPALAAFGAYLFMAYRDNS
jgi:hypothetical protein